MINRIRKYFADRRDERLREVSKEEAHQRWLAYMRRHKRVIMPQPKQDDRSSIETFQRILARE